MCHLIDAIAWEFDGKVKTTLVIDEVNKLEIIQ